MYALCTTNKSLAGGPSRYLTPHAYKDAPRELHDYI